MQAQAGFQIFTKIAGYQTFVLDVEASDSVENMKTKVQNLIGASPADMALFYNGQQMFDGNTLQDYSVQMETFITYYPAIRPLMVSGDALWGGDTTQSVIFSDYAAGALNVSSTEIDGSLDLTNAAAAHPITLNLATVTFGRAVALQNFDPGFDASWTLATATGGIIGYQANQFVVNTTSFLDAPATGHFSVVLNPNGTDLDLAYSAVPEPSSVGLLALGGAALLGLRRRSKESPRAKVARSARP